MRSFDRSPLRAIETGLAALVLLIALVTFAELPRPYPAWPTVGPIPADPELLVPGALGIVAIANAVLETVDDGFGVGATVTAALGAVTCWLAAVSVHTLLVGVGGVFFGGLFTLLAGVALAGAVFLRRAVGRRSSRVARRPA